LKQHKPRFEDEYSKLLGQRKQAKMQLLQNPSKTSGDNVNSMRHETRTFRNEKREYLKDKINELETKRTKISGICTEA